MGLNFPGRNLKTRTVYKIAEGGTATLAEAEATVRFINGTNNYTWTQPAGVFSAGNNGVLCKTGGGDITFSPGSGATFRHEMSGFDNQAVKLDGTYGYSLYWEMIEETYESNDVEVKSGNIYELPTGHPLTNTFVIGQKILVSGFTEAANNGVKTVAGFSGDQITVSESLTVEAAGGDIVITPQDTFEISGAIKAA